ncbi:MAG TPA: hypothetical protein VLH08_16325, partial [Acidobacteriota bacterium]|nr:hypothetical protein [Acidobacteriota bacterium]
IFVKQQRTPIHSLAVLPLKNLSGDPKQEYFADGMTEELITSLARIEALRVISRTSVMEYKTTKKQLPDIAKELNVDAIVEGAVMRSGNRVRISAQLLQASTDTHLWAESYERDLSDILALQNEVAQSIAKEVQIKLTPQDHARLSKAPTVNPEAYQAYLRGMYYFNDAEQSEQNVRLGIQMFEKAVEFDPTFVHAFTELSMMHSYIVGTGFEISEEHLSKAKAAVDRAFILQPDLPEGHLALGYYHYWGRKDYEKALKEFAVAAKDLPNNTWVLLGISYVVRRQGNFQTSINNMKKALELNPKDAETAGDLAMSYTITRRYSEAEHYCDLTRFLAPDVARAYQISAFNDWLWHGTTTKSALILQKMPKKQETTWSMGDLFWQHLHERQYQAALERLSSISEVPFKSRAEFISRDELAGIVYQLMNQPVKARASFDRARLLLESELSKRPEDHRVHSSLGIVYAGLERKQDAIREAKFAIKLYPVLKDTYAAPYYVENLALVYVMTGEHELALDQIEYLLSIPSFFSVPLLQLDPRWDPLRNHPRYTQVIRNISSKQGTSGNSTTSDPKHTPANFLAVARVLL